MRATRSITMLFVAFTMTCVSAAAVRAAVVPPGGSFVTDGQDFVAPTGDMVASDTRTVAFDYDLGEFTQGSDPVHFERQFTSQVLRDPATQRLTFVYRFLEVPGERDHGIEGGSFNVQSFLNFTTDVSTDGGWTINRSADGSNIAAESLGQGNGQIPYFVIATDATEFDTNGSLALSAEDEFNVIDPADQSSLVAVLTANISLTGTFQPIVDGGNGGGGGGGGGGTAIPLPPAAWTGLLALVVGGAAAKAQQFLRCA
jgi:hypothetical protein